MILKLLPVSMVLFFVLLSGSASAYLEMAAENNEKTVYLGDEVSFDIKMNNLRTIMDRLNVEVSGEPQEWVSSYPAFLIIQGESSSEFSVGFFPTGETTGRFPYIIKASSIQSPSESPIFVTEEVTLDVIRPLDIEDFSVSKEGNVLLLDILMSSKDRRQAELSFVIINSRGEFLERFSLTPEVNGITLVEETFPLPEDMMAGDYNVIVYLMGTPVKKEHMFTVMPIHMVTEEVKKTSSTLYEEFEITIVNEGNIEEKEYVTYKSFPNNDWVTGLVTDPDECFVRGGERTCKYVFADLAPGDSVNMEYRLDYWSIYATYILVVVAIFMLVFFGMRRATAPVIVKRHVRKAGGKHHVVLEVKNPFYHNLSNAIVRDWVSPLANVLHHEISVLKPLIRRSDAGTELIWKLGDIRPKETRIVTYPIKALVSGSLKMPRAYIRYNKPNGRLRRLFSKTLIVNA